MAERRARLPTVGHEKRRQALWGYAFVALPLALFLIWFIFPMLYAVYISFFDWGVRGKIEAVGVANYTEAVGDPLFWRAIRNTLIYTAGVVPSQMALGLFLAVIVNQKLRARTFFRSAFYFPAIASSAAITAIAIFILNADGILNRLIELVVGGEQNTPWFYTTTTALPSIIGLNAWTTSGTIMLFYLASLQSIPPDVYEAAAIDGASRWRTFWKITFPLLKPGHFFVAVVSVIGALKVFDQAFIVSGGTGGPNNATLTAVLYLYRQAISNVRFGYGAAIGVILFLLIFGFTLVQRKLFGDTEAA